MTKKKIYLITLIVVILAALSALFFYYRPFNKETAPNKTAASNKSASSSAEVYTNKKGQTWTVDQKSDFTVSSAPGAKISFLEGKIDPLKVHPGDTQKMRIVVKADNGVKSVIANIETDNGINKVELKKTGVVSVKDLDPSIFTYVVDKNNELQILSPQQAQAYRQKEIAAESGSLINSAQAGTGEREVWEASWLVKDTSVKEYNTTFIATDSQGNQDKLVLAWSDPCQDSSGADWKPNGGNFTTLANKSCSISSVYGIDGGTLTLGPSSNIILNDNATLVFNPEQSIKMNADGGKITINSSGGKKGMFTKGFIWALDNDNDHYAANDTRIYNDDPDNPPQAGYRRQKTLFSNTLDCYDNNINAYPGQTNFFTVQRGDGSFDYNCDGAINDSFAANVPPANGLFACSPIETCGDFLAYPDAGSFNTYDCRTPDSDGNCRDFDTSDWQDSTSCWVIPRNGTKNYPRASDIPACGAYGDAAAMNDIGGAYPTCTHLNPDDIKSVQRACN